MSGHDDDDDGFASAKIAQAMFEAAGGSPTDPRGPLFEWWHERQLEQAAEELRRAHAAHKPTPIRPSIVDDDEGARRREGAARQYAEELQQRYQADQEGGKRLSRALFEAVHICNKYGIPLPRWAARIFDRAHHKISRGQANSLDKLLGLPHGEGAHLDVLQRREQQMWPVYGAVMEMSRDGYALDESTFAIVAERMNEANLIKFKTKDGKTGLFAGPKSVVTRHVKVGTDGKIKGRLTGGEVSRLFYRARHEIEAMSEAERIIKFPFYF